jgi:ABC-type uncharacterized transport system permease subunit
MSNTIDSEASASPDQESETSTKFDRLIDNIYKQLGWALGSIILALFVGVLIMIASGYDPGYAYFTLFRSALRNPDQILWKATPLILTGLSVALAFRAGLFNIGAEGQLYMGSIFATIIGFTIVLPIIVHPIVCVLVGILFGALWGLIPGLLKAYRGAHEVVTTMMLSYVAMFFTNYLVTGPLKEPGQWAAQTPPMFLTSWLPKLGLLPIWESDYLSYAFIVAIIATIAVYFFLTRMVLGYELRATGQNEKAAEAAGINTKRIVVIAMVLSGALAGIAGAVEVQGFYHRFIDGWSGGLGFDGITVAVLGANGPIGVLLAAIFFGFLRAGALSMQSSAGVPVEMITVIQGLILIFVAAPRIIEWMASRGVKNARWIVKNPLNALPIFITSILALVGVIISLAVGFGYLIINAPVTISLSLIAILSIAAFIMSLKVERYGPLLGLITSIGWIIVGGLNFVFESGTLAIPLLVFGVFGIIFSVYSFYLIQFRGVQMMPELDVITKEDET